ncbi:MAG TPA: WXG100 family type VII secretion target [Intrasporangiaceae bacterium]|nr:WXG100 family type VII secretion target [Intrasporangiaceae bacterium]
MSATFQVDTGRIHSASGDIASISAEIESLVATMLSRLTALQDAWTGSAATRFQGVVHEWRGTQQHVKASLDSIGVALGQAGTHYADAEATNLQMFT